MTHGGAATLCRPVSPYTVTNYAKPVIQWSEQPAYAVRFLLCTFLLSAFFCPRTMYRPKCEIVL